MSVVESLLFCLSVWEVDQSQPHMLGPSGFSCSHVAASFGGGKKEISGHREGRMEKRENGVKENVDSKSHSGPPACCRW